MPAKLLSCSFLMLLLPWFSLFRERPRSLCFAVSSSSSCLLFLLLFILLLSHLLYLTLPPPSSFPPVCYLYRCCPPRLPLLRSVAASSRRGRRSGRGSQPRTAPNKAAFFTKVPRLQLSDASHLCEDLH